MGVGLDLLIIPHQFTDQNEWLGYDRLHINKHYRLFEQFGLNSFQPDKEKARIDAPIDLYPLDDKKIKVFKDEGIITTQNNRYKNDILYYTYAEEFKKIDLEIAQSNWSKSIVKFIRNLHSETIIVFYWT
mgnify:CR=1 FL=1